MSVLFSSQLGNRGLSVLLGSQLGNRGLSVLLGSQLRWKLQLSWRACKGTVAINLSQVDFRCLQCHWATS